MKFLVVIATSILLAMTYPAAAAKRAESILLRNVSLIDPDNPAELLKVNILIRDNKLDLVSQDLIALDEAEVTYDVRDGEWMEADVESPIMEDPTVDGYHVTASWALTGEMREYKKRVGIFKRLPIARTVNQNGWGAWELGLRYSTLNANDSLLEAGDMDIWSAGLNWWLTPYFNVNMNYRYITLDKDGLEGTSHGINTRVVLVLE